MPVPLCPLLVAANAIGASIDGDVGNVADRVALSACLGSLCSWWVADPDPNEHMGSCGLGNGQRYDDPARPTTRVPKRKPT